MNKRNLFVLVIAVSMFLLVSVSASLAASYNLKLAHNLPPTDSSLYHQAALKFKELIEKESGGEISVQIFAASQLGSDVSVAKKVQGGAIEMEILTANKLGAFYPPIDLYSLPFLLKDFDVAAKVFQTSVHKGITDELEKKSEIKTLAFVGAGFRNITNSKHPINKPEDLKDLKIRIPENKIELATFKALGANPVNIPGSELFSALQQGVADGQDGSADWAYAKKFYEVQKYLAVTHHQLSTSTMIINAKFFSSLPQKLQESVLKASKETEAYWQKLCKDGDNDVIDRFKAKGMQITYPDLDLFIQKVQPVYSEFADRLGGMDKIKAVQAVK
ncbi:MAG: TRAP transporter substrate-binding protein [Desulfobacterales bacterium]|nr:TRAP transporter substrate-binding protein [Desulfobacterales bacterium]